MEFNLVLLAADDIFEGGYCKRLLVATFKIILNDEGDIVSYHIAACGLHKTWQHEGDIDIWYTSKVNGLV